MLDSLYCSELGLPAAAIISTPFQKLAAATCRNMGREIHPVMVIEHPVWTREDAWIEARGEELAEKLIPILGRRGQ